MIALQEQLALITTQFHWLRPWWLLAFIPMVILSILLWRQKHQAHQWQQLIAPELLPFLLDGKTITTKKSLLWGLILAWFIGTIALAGPSWVKRPTPVEKNQNALVILLDLSLSMLSEDVKPSRIVRARLKIADILRERKDGQTALVVYAGEAHTVTPLSDDNATIVSLLPALQPNIMPLQGSNTEAAVERGIRLLHDAGATRGDILLITDGVVPEAFDRIQELLANKKIRLNILGVGTNQPAPIASGNGGFLRDNQGAIITTHLNSGELQTLAQQIRGRYSDIANTNSDIDLLLPSEEKSDENNPTLERDFDQWFDQGHWLVFLLLPIILFSFRRGFILMLVCIPLLGLTPRPAYAIGLDDIGLSNMWLTKDQQAQRALAAGDAKKAAEQFKSPDWKASAQYRAGDYAAAAEGFAKSDTATAHYNRGNALAKAGKLEDAIKAYDESLERDATAEDTKKNRALVEELLKQQKQQDQQKNDQKKDSDKKDQDKKDQDKQDQDKQDPEKQDQEKSQDQENQDQKDQQNKEQQEQDQQNKEQQDKQQKEQEQQGQASSAAQQSAAAQGQASSAAASDKSQQMGQASSQSQSEQSAEQKAQAALNEDNLSEEQKQALEQWLRRVPDDPGGLLRNKFKYQYLQNRQKRADGEFEAPKNNADQRW
ncbi:MAG: VWA domain-containing protein [Pseudomonadota bacterium]